jgi:hypothetical protein
LPPTPEEVATNQTNWALIFFGASHFQVFLLAAMNLGYLFLLPLQRLLLLLLLVPG